MKMNRPSCEAEKVRILLHTAVAFPSFLGWRKCSKSFSFSQLLENHLKVGSCNQVLSLGEPDEECDQDICCQGWPRDKGKVQGCRENKNLKSSQTSWVPLVLGWGRGERQGCFRLCFCSTLAKKPCSHPSCLTPQVCRDAGEGMGTQEAYLSLIPLGASTLESQASLESAFHTFCN